ncbi:helix-turn-helix domain-containing protein [Lysinibacillus sp. NPDC093712]|uniref:helix-turn-helix domain-containing protein n=1 Tax=Lysinibacillus sp. NPDC093712 TaxID=3390579 RepID=UPI003CFF883D
MNSGQVLSIKITQYNVLFKDWRCCILIFKLKEVRKSRGLSRYQFEKLSGVNDSTLQMIENNEKPNPTFKIMCKIADALEVSLDELRGR